MIDEYDFSHASPNPHAARLAGQALSTPTTRSEAEPPATVTVHRDKTGMYRWRLVTAEGAVVAQSALGYHTREAVIAAVRTVAGVFPLAAVHAA